MRLLLTVGKPRVLVVGDEVESEKIIDLLRQTGVPVEEVVDKAKNTTEICKQMIINGLYKKIICALLPTKHHNLGEVKNFLEGGLPCLVI